MPKLRRHLAAFVLFAMAVAWAVLVALAWDRAGALRALWWGVMFVGPAVLSATGVAFGWWWARLVGLGFGLFVTSWLPFGGWEPLILYFAGGPIVLVLLGGARMFAAFEGRGAWSDAADPRMTIARLALVAGISALLFGVLRLPVWESQASCFVVGPPPDPIMRLPGMRVGLFGITASIALWGLVRLFQARTAGLLVVAASSLAVPLVVAQDLVIGTVAIQFGPSLLLAWAAVFALVLPALRAR